MEIATRQSKVDGRQSVVRIKESVWVCRSVASGRQRMLEAGGRGSDVGGQRSVVAGLRLLVGGRQQQVTVVGQQLPVGSRRSAVGGRWPVTIVELDQGQNILNKLPCHSLLHTGGSRSHTKPARISYRPRHVAGDGT